MKILKNKKALSPVVASIILIAVTVAVSIAVAAWMGALTFTFTATEQLQITQVEFLTGGLVNVTLQNTGTSPITVTEIHINGGTSPSGDLLSSDVTIPANSQREVQVSYTWSAGSNYQVRVVTSKGNQYYYSAVAPTS
jgi:flagellin-like protein